MSVVQLTEPEEEDLYLLLKGREDRLSEGLRRLLREIEGILYARLSIEDMERLEKRSVAER